MEDLDPEEAGAIIDPALKLMIDADHRYDGYVVSAGHPFYTRLNVLLDAEDFDRFVRRKYGLGTITTTPMRE
jgi:hypothetical protein